MKSRNKVENKTDTWGLSYLTGKEEEVTPLTSADISRSERKLDITEQRERENAKAWSIRKY